MSQKFVLASDGTRIELIYGEFEAPKNGQNFRRDPVTGSATWTIVKVFDFDEQRLLAALAGVTGHTALAKLFECRPLGY